MLKFEDNYINIPVGTIGLIEHQGGEYKNGRIVGGKLIKKRIIRNLIVDKASELMAARMAPGATIGSGTASLTGDMLDNGLQFLALGVGQMVDPDQLYDESTNPVDTVSWDLQNPPVETLGTTKLVGELYRKPFTSWRFLNADGTETADITNILSLTTTFYEDEANGPLTEMGLFGGDALDWNSGAGRNSGYMFNYRTFKVWNKPSSSRLTIVWKLTF